VVAYLKDFLFSERQIFSPVGTLSGGEKNRLLLAKILTQPSSILVLDEPTNDLDMDTLDVLIDILSDYDGTLIIVSHDRYFIDRLVTSTLIMNGNADIQEYVGGYTENQHHLKLAEPVERKSQTPKIAAPKSAKPQKLSYKFIHEQALLSANIELWQKEITQLEEKLSDESLYLNNPREFSAHSDALFEKKQQLLLAEERWLSIELMKEELAR
jgi:ATP-binding cassette subfamily F protein uup